jgi:hypothetical protein
MSLYTLNAKSRFYLFFSQLVAGAIRMKDDDVKQTKGIRTQTCHVEVNSSKYYLIQTYKKEIRQFHLPLMFRYICLQLYF